MKVPESPPSLSEALNNLVKQGDSSRLGRLFSANIGPADVKNRYIKNKYLHWEKLKHAIPPEGFTSKECWFATKTARNTLSKKHL